MLDIGWGTCRKVEGYLLALSLRAGTEFVLAMCHREQFS
jgi:hypothetical protein